MSEEICCYMGLPFACLGPAEPPHHALLLQSRGCHIVPAAPANQSQVCVLHLLQKFHLVHGSGSNEQQVEADTWI